MSPRTRIKHLPGIGLQYDFTTADGEHLSVVAHRNGSRSLDGYRGDEPDGVFSLHLTADEAAVLADALLAGHDDPRLLRADELGLVAERIALSAASRWHGRPLGTTQLRTRTGASIVAILRGSNPIPSPAAAFRLAGGDTLVVVGTREGADAAAALLTKD
ncbi:MAG TPA: TrkA C-terminal domain-containing protein [Streptosporangiaceae bacterium]|nr:TrkA C-terminal domain-containing protein [Streptosporangiaceae bacterium]